MATFRVGVGSFNIKDGAVGFGTDTDGLGNLKVKGVTKTTGSIVSGASTLTRYSGFAADNVNQLENITLTSEVGTIGDIVVGVGTSVIISTASTVTVGTVESVSIGTHFSPPVGGIEDRGQDFVEGMMRYNTDLDTMEFYNGNEWKQFTYRQDFQNSPSSMGRGIFSGYFINEFVQVSTEGNSVDFGRLTNNLYGGASGSSSTRGLVMGGWGPTPGSPGQDLDVEYITLASAGDAIDFGADNSGGWGSQGASDSVRALSAGGGYPSATANIDMFIFSTVGTKVDFGDIRAGRARRDRGACSPVRSIFCGTYGPVISTYDTKLTASSGDTTEFGDIMYNERYSSSVSDHTRGIVQGAYAADKSSYTSMAETFTIASTGVAFHFGEMTIDKCGARAGCQNMVRGLFGGGSITGGSPSITNAIDKITIQTNGNGIDFGDLTRQGHSLYGMSDTHGGLGGY